MKWMREKSYDDIDIIVPNIFGLAMGLKLTSLDKKMLPDEYLLLEVSLQESRNCGLKYWSGTYH